LRALGLDHVDLSATDLERSTAFYAEWLGDTAGGR